MEFIKINSIEKTNQKTDMYDLSVQGNHNFILENGVVTHNSGKTLTAVKHILDSKTYALTNFSLKGKIPYRRLRFSDIISENVDYNSLGKASIKKTVNWDFWNKVKHEHKNFNVYIDEIHNLIHARRAMSSVSVVMSIWVSQIRKILANSEDSHLIIISQEARKIDIDFRELLDLIIYCKCIKKGDRHYIKLTFYNDIDAYMDERPQRKRMLFNAKPYYRFYDTYEFVRFGEESEFI